MNIPTEHKQRIRELWTEIEDQEPDISTERLISFVVERINNELSTDYDCGDVCEAMRPEDI